MPIDHCFTFPLILYYFQSIHLCCKSQESMCWGKITWAKSQNSPWIPILTLLLRYISEKLNISHCMRQERLFIYIVFYVQLFSTSLSYNSSHHIILVVVCESIIVPFVTALVASVTFFALYVL